MIVLSKCGVRAGLSAALAACFVAAGLCAPARAGSLDNGRLSVTAQAGAPVTVTTKGAGGKSTRFELALCGAVGAGGTAGIDKVGSGPGGAMRVSLGGVEADLALSKDGAPYLTVTPVKAGGALEVRAAGRYAVLPDFFGYDVVYDAARFKGGSLLVPAENFLLNFVEGNRAIVMCVWPGTLTDAKDGAGGSPAAKPAGREPAVHLLLGGDGDARKVTASRIELVGGPVHVAVLEHEGLWYDREVASCKALEPIKLDWKRPFDAHWRLDTMVAEGKQSKDLISRSQSYRFLYAPTAEQLKRIRADRPKGADVDIEDTRAWIDREKIWAKEYPMVAEEGIYIHIYQAWFRADEAYIALYADDPFHAKDPSKIENIFDRVLVYPLDRDPASPGETPMEVYTFVDIMKATLGQEPCKYVLDLEGVKSRNSSGAGDHKLLDDATCTIWQNHVYPALVSKTELSAEQKQHLIRAVKDLTVFLKAVNVRMEEYASFNDRLLKLAEENKGRGPVAARVGAVATAMKAMLDKYNVVKCKAEVERWDKAVEEVIPKIEAGNHKEVEKLVRVKALGQEQDNAVSFCRRYVKAIQNEASFVDGDDPEAQKFALAVRDMCREVMRNPHPKELLHSDINSARTGLTRDQRMPAPPTKKP